MVTSPRHDTALMAELLSWASMHSNEYTRIAADCQRTPADGLSTLRNPQRERRRRIQAHAWRHSGAEHDALDVLPLCATRLGAHDGVNRRGEVLQQLLVGERELANRDMDQAGSIHPELDTPA